MRIFGLQVIVLFPSLLRCFLSRANVAFFWTQQSLHRQNRRRKESEGTSASRLSSLFLLSVSPFLRRGVVFVIRVCHILFLFIPIVSEQKRRERKQKARLRATRLSTSLFSLSRYSPPSLIFFNPAETAKQRECERKERKY